MKEKLIKKHTSDNSRQTCLEPQPCCSNENGGGVRCGHGWGDCHTYNNKNMILIIKNRGEKIGTIPSFIEVVLVLQMWMLDVVDVVDASLLEWASTDPVIRGRRRRKEQTTCKRDESQNQPINHVIIIDLKKKRKFEVITVSCFPYTTSSPVSHVCYHPHLV